MHSSEVFPKSNLFIFGYFDPEKMFLIMKVNNFPVYLSDISAKAASLVHMRDMMRWTV